ncbi:hypothetical protein [[Clostridium] colinum]|uniref:hypothetical protein n=1 Tax=[Clostridium] colinum TaxID=36835 RepID=UPI00202481C0|nr:hypothetical protein [[Clostridium] colinum]
MKIQGIKGYNDEKTAVMGESAKLESGNYLCKILNAKCENSKSGNPMLILQFDIAEGDFKDYYRQSFEANKKVDANATFKGVFYQNMTGASLKFYKGVLTSIEKSNNIKIDGENGFDSEILKEKVFLGRFGEEEYLGNDNQVKSVTKLRFISSTDKKDLPILDKKVLKDAPKKQDDDSFYSVEENVDEDRLPF